MPWFRWKRKKDEQVAPEGAASEALTAPAEPEVEPEETGAPVADGEAPKRRRRGSRGGRGRKKPAGDASAETAGEESDQRARGDRRPAKSDKTDKTEKTERSQRAERAADRRRQAQQSSGQRRRQAPRRAPLPAAKRELLISVDVGEQRVAVIEDDKVAEVYLERPERRSIAGNIYLGVVDNVLPGMEAAFVEIGLEKNGFLYVDEIVVPELEGKRHGKKIQDLISRGEQILVQAVKDPMKTKGARLTTEISLPGRFLVYVPNGEGLGVSRRLEDAERNRLKDIIKSLAVKEGGVIVRTAAEGASAEDIERDFVFLQRLWKTIQARAQSASAPSLVYQEAELPLRIVRDLFAGDFIAAHVDSERTHKRILSYLKKTSPHMIDRVHRYKEKEPLFEVRGVEKEISSTLDRRVDLPSGGYLVFDYAEAFTVVDVNTGRFVGSRSKNSTQRLEDTITKNNLEAVKEVVRQLRLRDIGGIIVIDFIDMANPKNRASVEDALRHELERDRTKTYVVEISPLGLVEMTRQNVTDGPREILTRKCPTCGGDGIVVSDQTVAMQVERKLRALAAPGSRVQAYTVALHPRVLELVAGPGGARLAALEEATRRHFFLVPAEGHVHQDHFEVLAEGKLTDLQPASPLEPGATVELKLGEVGRYDATAASGRVDGVEVIVADAAKQVGKKATVRVGHVLDGQAFATLVVEGASGEGPITFESEAEKPTRAPARRKAAAAVEAEADDTVETETEIEAEAVLEPGEADADAAEPDEDEVAGAATPEGDEGAAPKKRTRRGSRGGRRRRKTPGTAADGEAADDAAGDDGAAPAEDVVSPGAADGEEPPAEEPPAEPRPRTRRRAPRIHVPDDGNGAPSPAVIEEVVAEAIELVEEPVEEPADEPVAETEPVAEAEPETEPVVAEGDAPVAVKKKTRRGTRGGRNRRKKAPATANGAEASPEDADAVEAVADTEIEPSPEPEPEIQAATEVEEDAEPVAGVEAEVEAEAEVELEAEAVEEVAAVEETPQAEASDEPEASPDGYVPMSEWLDDFDRR